MTTLEELNFSLSVRAKAADDHRKRLQMVTNDQRLNDLEDFAMRYCMEVLGIAPDPDKFERGVNANGHPRVLFSIDGIQFRAQYKAKRKNKGWRVYLDRPQLSCVTDRGSIVVKELADVGAVLS